MDPTLLEYDIVAGHKSCYDIVQYELYTSFTIAKISHWCDWSDIDIGSKSYDAPAGKRFKISAQQRYCWVSYLQISPFPPAENVLFFSWYSINEF